MRVLVLGASGMLGSSVFRLFSSDRSYVAWGTIRNTVTRNHFVENMHERLLSGVDVLDHDALVRTLEYVRPDVVVNCVGIIKQLADAQDPLTILPINSLLPHKLAKLCSLLGARLIHISTDCVFSGRKGFYSEADLSDAEDLYGKSKFIGEVHKQGNTVTLRTSIIGHELQSNVALVDWFLSQKHSVKGFSRAIFSGVPTIELASVIKDYVVNNASLQGLYHVAAAPISKLDLLKLISVQYGKNIDIVSDDEVVVNRSLNAERFHLATGYSAPDWPDLIKRMYDSGQNARRPL